MTTRTWNQYIGMGSDADYRSSFSTLFTNLTACGLVQTSDTGQVDLVSGTRSGGYAIWRLPTSNLYFKFTISGTSNTLNFSIQVGTGSNGSGTLTGQTSTNTNHNTNGTAWNTLTQGISFCCVTNETFTLVWGLSTGSSSQTACLFHAGRTANSDGVATSDGYMWGIGNTAGGQFRTQCVKTAATAFTGSLTSGTQCTVPGTPTDTTDGSGSKQTYTWWMNLPYGQPYLYALTWRSNEFEAYSVISVKPFGTTSRSYLLIGTGASGSIGSAQNSNTWQVAFLWE